MIPLSELDGLARRLSDLVPSALQPAREELCTAFKSALQSGLNALHLVTREEFDVQCALLARTRAKLEELERTLSSLNTEASSYKRSTDGTETR